MKIDWHDALFSKNIRSRKVNCLYFLKKNIERGNLNFLKIFSQGFLKNIFRARFFKDFKGIFFQGLKNQKTRCGFFLIFPKDYWSKKRGFFLDIFPRIFGAKGVDFYTYFMRGFFLIFTQ